jgi:immunoglobulin-binding protein 1
LIDTTNYRLILCCLDLAATPKNQIDMSSSDDHEPSSLSATFTAAEALRNQLDITPSNSAGFASTLASAIQKYKQCIELSQKLGLFSPNETLDDVATASLPFLLLHFRRSELILRIPGGVEAGRKNAILEARIEIEKFLGQLDNYDLLGGKAESEMWERYVEDKNEFEVIGKGADPQTRRNGKITRWKQEKELKAKLQVCILSEETELTWTVSLAKHPHRNLRRQLGPNIASGKYQPRYT